MTGSTLPAAHARHDCKHCLHCLKACRPRAYRRKASAAVRAFSATLTLEPPAIALQGGVSAEEAAVPEVITQAGRETLEIVFLGTGAAIPAKYRNVTGIYLHLFARGGMMVDCGGVQRPPPRRGPWACCMASAHRRQLN